MENPIRKFRHWYCDPEQELLRREVRWTLKWLRSRYVVMLFISILLLSSMAIALFESRAHYLSSSITLYMWPAISFLYPTNLIQLVFFVWVMEKRSLALIGPNRLLEILASPLKVSTVFAAALAPPLIILNLLIFIFYCAVVLNMFLDSVVQHYNSLYFPNWFEVLREFSFMDFFENIPALVLVFGFIANVAWASLLASLVVWLASSGRIGRVSCVFMFIATSLAYLYLRQLCVQYLYNRALHQGGGVNYTKYNNITLLCTSFLILIGASLSALLLRNLLGKQSRERLLVRLEKGLPFMNSH